MKSSQRQDLEMVSLIPRTSEDLRCLTCAAKVGTKEAGLTERRTLDRQLCHSGLSMTYHTPAAQEVTSSTIIAHLGSWTVDLKRIRVEEETGSLQDVARGLGEAFQSAGCLSVLWP